MTTPAFIPPLPFTVAQLLQALEALEAEIGSGVTIPEPPLTGDAIRAILVAMAGHADQGIVVPAGAMTGAQLRGVLLALRAAAWPDAEPSPEPTLPTQPEGRAGGVLVGAVPPGPEDGRRGDVWIVAADDLLTFYGPKQVSGWEQLFRVDATPAPPPRRLLLENLRSPDPWDLDLMTETRTLARVSASVRGTDADVTFGLFHGPIPGVDGVAVVNGGIHVTDQTVVEAFDSAVIPEGHWLWFDVLALAGAVDKLSVGVEYA